VGETERELSHRSSRSPPRSRFARRSRRSR
jgi:hypothetical protein